MSKTLHITNGDAFTLTLQQLPIKGEIITWREMLCEGKTSVDVGSESFWKTRFEYLNRKYKVTKNKFINFTLKEYRNLCNQKQQSEIVLWFEYDLFCQINMIAVISWLHKHRKGADIYLVCSGKEDDTNKMYGLNELSKDQLMSLYNNKIQLTLDDIEYADYIWQLYCSDNPMRLETFTKFNSSQFEYLPDALEAHIKRFPAIKNGLNYLENKILEKAANNSFKTKEQLIGNMLRDQDMYGFGDLQFYRMLTDLKQLFTSYYPVKLSKKGKAVLNKKENFYATIKDDSLYLGGAPKYAFLYNELDHKLLKL